MLKPLFNIAFGLIVAWVLLGFVYFKVIPRVIERYREVVDSRREYKKRIQEIHESDK